MSSNFTPSLHNTNVLIVAGVETHHRFEREMAAACRPSYEAPGCFNSEDVCAFQTHVHGQGRRVLRLARSKFGWSVRANSGLEGFALVASVSTGELDGSFSSARAWASKWQAEDPLLRSVIAYAMDLSDLDESTQAV